MIAYLQKTRPLVDERMNILFDKEKRRYYKLDSANLLQNLKEYTKRGKYIRSSLFILSCEMFGIAPAANHYDLAAAIEIMHSSFLIHDDIMDNSPLRRGLPAIHSLYRERGEENKLRFPDEYGKSMAICMGDIALFVAHNIMTKAVNTFPNCEAILDYLIREYLYVGFAQAKDVEFGYMYHNPPLEDIRQVYKYKTARYTFSLPLMLGAYIAQKDAPLIKQLNELGENIGMLFQIRDDEIGLFYDTNITGKPKAGDLRENKKTLIRSLLVKSCSPSDRKKIETIFRKNYLLDTDINTVYLFIEKYNIKEKLQEIKNEYLKTGLNLLRSLPVTDHYKQLLARLIDFVAKREK